MCLLNLVEKQSIIKSDKMNETEYLCLFQSSELLDISITWQYNRDLNGDKIDKIKKYIVDKCILDTVLYFYLYDNTLICYDGNHRLQALKELYVKNDIDMNVCCYINLPQTDNIDVEIRDRFNMLNTNTPIPDIYLDIVNNLDNVNHNKLIALNNKKAIIERVFKKYCHVYTNFYKTSNKPRKPNFNDTMFKDLCNGFHFETRVDLIEHLERINDENRNKLMSVNIRKKCDAHEFYIFN
jgi:hypothetical protein